jgi:AraC-like DNA-binding protein
VLVNPGPGALGAAHVVLNARGRRHEVEGFPGPLSIKSVLRGTAEWRTDAGRFVLDPGRYLVLNEGRRYGMTVDSEMPVETLCIFFRHGFAEEAAWTRKTSEIRLLDDPEMPRGRAFEVAETLRPHDRWVSPELSRLRAGLAAGTAPALWLEERVHALAAALVRAERDLAGAADRLPAARAATRDELSRRLRRARDAAEAALGERLSLARLAREACLSTFHFHRAFTALFGETPHGYVTRRRLERARDALARSDRAVTEIALDHGFESPSSFSTLFRRRFGLSPRQFRLAART